MSNILIEDIIDKLLKLKLVMNTLDKVKMRDDIKDIDKIIENLKKESFKLNGYVEAKDKESITKNRHTHDKGKKSPKTSFNDAVLLLAEQKFDEIKGIKLNYNEFIRDSYIIEYFCNTEKKNILKAVTVLDLKLIYCILTDSDKEIKGKKDDLFEVIINNIKAKKRGNAFKNYI